MRETEETIETALFDVDGTLVASNDAHARAWCDALAEGGYDVAFEHAMKPDDVEGSKPDPDIVVAALAWSGTPPERAVMIGDTRFDMEAAARAGVAAIGLRSGGSGDADLAAAAAIFDTPADLARALAATSLGAIVRGERTRA